MKPAPSEQISVVIPVFNEADNIVPLIEEIHSALEGYQAYEIIIVDDGSRDETYDKVAALQPQAPNVRVLRHPSNLGQSTSIVSGVYAARYAWIVTLDGDGQNDPSDIIKLVQAAETYLPTNSWLLVAGHRIHRRDSHWKKLGSRIANVMRRRMLGDDCPDTGCGIKLFARNAFLHLPHFDHLHRYLPALFQRANGKVINVAVKHRPRQAGQSKYGNLSRLKVGIVDLLGVAWLIRRPCLFQLKQKPEASQDIN